MSESKVYGQSLYQVAKEDGTEKETLSELRKIAGLFSEHPDYVKILDSPQIAREELMGIINQDFFAHVSRYTVNFIKVLCSRRIVHHIGECLSEYERLYNKDNNIRVVSVTTAKPMKNELIDKLISGLEKKFGSGIMLKQYVDRTCIGGIVIEADGMKIDSSIKSELENLKKALI